MNNALLRILTALIAVPIVILLIYLGGWYFTLLVVAIGAGSQLELYNLTRSLARPYIIPGLVLGIVVMLRTLFKPWLLVVTAGVLAVMIWSIFDRREKSLLNAALTVTGLIYPALFLSYLVILRIHPGDTLTEHHTFYLTLGLFVMVWTTDTFAYYSGKLLGRHPLLPRISPKKTWEGSIGGFVGCVLFGIILKVTVLDFIAWPHILALIIICGAIGQLGDLVESLYKRSLDTKDSGAMLPGHGGFLDRFDAMIVCAPLYYMYLHLIAGLY